MKRHKNKFTRDFSSAARNVNDDFKPTELTNPVPWPFIAIAIALAIFGGLTLYFDAKSTPEGEAAQRERTAEEEGLAPADATDAEIKEAKADLVASQGAALFGTYCATCHQTNGVGVRNSIPPLDGSRYVMATAEVPISIVLRGISGPIEVKGDIYSGRMPAFHTALEDREIALILTHIRSSWSNDTKAVSTEQVVTARKSLENKLGSPWQGGFEIKNIFGIEYTLGADSQAKNQVTESAQASEDQEDTP